MKEIWREARIAYIFTTTARHRRSGMLSRAIFLSEASWGPTMALSFYELLSIESYFYNISEDTTKISLIETNIFPL
jgi:hypothetical protein